jgi:hypothetical protein
VTVAGASDWPVDLRGVTETVVTTPGPEAGWNVAALGVHAPDGPRDRPTARTWGGTRTRRNFERGAEGYVQFTRDPVDFAEAALTVREEADPLLDSADGWVRVRPTRIDSGTEADTTWVEWELGAVETAVRARTVPTTNRGYPAVVEATVAASRLDVPAYDRDELASRLGYLERVADRCGGPDERAAFDVIREAADW